MKYDLSNNSQVLSITELPRSERPRERLFELGPQFLSDEELACVLLGSGTRGRDVRSVARSVVAFLDGLGGCSQPDPRQLLGVEGLGAAKAAMLCACLELGRRRCVSVKKVARHPSEIFNVIRHFGDREQESFLSILLNGAHEIMGVNVVSVGLVNRSLVHPREVFADALRLRATAIVIAHNHPSGNLEPSQEDLMVTEMLIKSGKLLGIRVLDHLIFSSDGYLSMMETGRFFAF